MTFKLVIISAFLGIASAYVYSAPSTLIRSNQHAPLNVVHVKENSLPQYTFNYGVHDSISGDSKTATETRHGNYVKGEYSLNDADGYKRTVSYTADAKHGFQAVVERKPIADVADDIQSSIGAKSSGSIAAPLVIKNLATLDSTARIRIGHQPAAAPLVYYTRELVRSAPLVYYSDPLIINSSPIVYSSSPIINNPAPVRVVSHSVVSKPSPLVLAPTHSGPYYYVKGAQVAQEQPILEIN